jgi:hypothetical protein
MTTLKRKRTKKPSTKDTATEAVDVAAEATNPQEAGQPTTISLNDLKIGYVVGITQEGQFLFEMLGENKGLVELLGIHQHAAHQVNRIYGEQQMSGDRLIHEVGRAVASIVQKLDDGSKIKEEDVVVEPPTTTENPVAAE